MPVSGPIAWTVIGIAGMFLPDDLAAWVLFIGTGMIFGVALLIAPLFGEDLLGKKNPNNVFDQLFF
jgi:hypothetical protein